MVVSCVNLAIAVAPQEGAKAARASEGHVVICHIANRVGGDVRPLSTRVVRCDR